MADQPQDQTLGNFKSELEKLLSLSAADFGQAAERMSSYALNINKFFGQGRQRMTELMTSVADSLPNVTRLGGGIQDVAETIKDVAEASRRNVIASEKDVEKLYAATKVLGIGAEQLSNSFMDIGVGIEQIPTQLENSMEYIRSIGGNTKQVMSDVQRNMDQMNRYQFEGGVQGLTKMAAQASMLRFNMNETFKLADKVLDPEGAIETAAAFQRLGVASGNLADPFQLMNQSINDPSGLQNSLADVAKQFTYFDEKTKTFKINPQGVLTLREMEKQTGVSAAEMSKMGLAAAELDKRLSAVNAAGLKITNEEDKQFLANIAKLGEKGTYEVTLKDGTKKELSQLNQEEFDALIKEQKEGPKTLEDLARAQMNTTEIIKGDLQAIKDKLLYGIVSAPQITTSMEAARRMVGTTTGELSKMGETKDVRAQTNLFFKNLEQLGTDLKNPNKSTLDAFQEMLTRYGTQFKDIKDKFGDGLTKTVGKIAEGQSDKTVVERQYAEALKSFLANKESTYGGKTLSQYVEGVKSAKIPEEAKGTGTNANVTTTSEVGINGRIQVDINLPANFNQLDKEQQQKTLDAIFNSQQFQQMVANISAQKNPTKAPTETSYKK